ncbi:transmembrane emp24 domain-containing protein 2 [Drosophila ficusphila]|uniref:transmembrane emp24 domain-containing protein 2 n=1 Tax=Drosophila ficusphila TaxID=30025 RepID=UPI0007E7FD05|nr:transmembrane emp24 domain-containing protein 2 [Drosophila ficusphila]
MGNRNKSNMLSIIMIIVLLLESACGFIITVDAHETMCFYDHANVSDKVTISFEVMEGGFKDVGVEISGPEDDWLHHSEQETLGSFTFTALKDGQYQLCFNNEMSTLTPKVLMFQFHIARALEYYSDPSNRKDDVLEQAKVQGMVNQLSAELGAVKIEQEYMHFRYRGHIHVSDTVHFRVIAWSVFGPMMLLITALLEVYYLRHFFEIRKVV